MYLMKWAITQLDPNRPALEAAMRRQKELERQLGRSLVRLQGLEAVSGIVAQTRVALTLLVLPLRLNSLVQLLLKPSD